MKADSTYTTWGRRVTFPLLGMLLLGVAGCGWHSTASPPASAEPNAAMSCAAVKPERKALTILVEQPGQIEAFEQTPIYAKIEGHVEKVCVDMDARVKKGDCLAKLWVPEREDDYRHTRAAVAQAGAELEQVKRSLVAADASIKAAEALVEEVRTGLTRARANKERYDSEVRRIRQLVQSGVIDRQTLDEAVNQSKAAAAAVDEVTAKVRAAEAARNEKIARKAQIEADVEVARTHLDVARTDERRAKTMLEYASINAPFTGVVARRSVHTGHLLKPGEGANHQPLFVLVRTDPVRIFVNVPESEAGHVRIGTHARVRIQALRDLEIDAKVVRTSWALDPGNRTLRTEVELPNPDGKLRPGMYAYAAILVEHPPAWTIPAAAVHRSDDAPYCYLAVNGKAVHTALRLGATDGKLTEVLRKRVRSEEGGTRWAELSGNEVVLLDDTGGLSDGRPVSIKGVKSER